MVHVFILHTEHTLQQLCLFHHVMLFCNKGCDLCNDAQLCYHLPSHVNPEGPSRRRFPLGKGLHVHLVVLHEQNTICWPLNTSPGQQMYKVKQAAPLISCGHLVSRTADTITWQEHNRERACEIGGVPHFRD